MARLLTDALMRAVTALPAAGASNSSEAIDLRQKTAETIGESFEVQLIVPSLPALAENKTATFTFEDSEDGETFTPIPELATLVVTGEAGGGAPEHVRTVRLPSSARQHIRVSQEVLAEGGDNTAVSTTLQLLF